MSTTDGRVMRAGLWWALVRSPRSLPVIFSTREQAASDRDPDEQIVRVAVVPLDRKPRTKSGRKR